MSCVTREVTLPLEADEAWDAVTELSDWLAEDADLDLEPGREGTLRLRDGEERRAVVDDVRPGERLAFWWWVEGAPATHVELTLAPAVSGTRIVVVESGFSTGPVATSGLHAGPPAAGAVSRSAVGALPVGLVTLLVRAPALLDDLADAAGRRIVLA